MESRTMTVKLKEVEELFFFLQGLHRIYHSNERSSDPRLVQSFWSEGGYSKLNKLYYEVVWNWLPEDVRNEIENNS